MEICRKGGAELKKICYISHPYADNPSINKLLVDKVCRDIIAQGEYVTLSPIHLFSCYDDDSDREIIMRICLRLITLANEVWVYGDSSGCQAEAARARELGIKVVDKRTKKASPVGADEAEVKHYYR
jgi:hypothetical protein